MVLPLSSLTDMVKMLSCNTVVFYDIRAGMGLSRCIRRGPPCCASAASPVASVLRPGGKNCTLKVLGAVRCREPGERAVDAQNKWRLQALQSGGPAFA